MTKNYSVILRCLLICIAFTVSVMTASAQTIKTKKFSKDEAKVSKVDDELLNLKKTPTSSKQRVTGQVPDKHLQVVDGYVVLDVSAKGDPQKLASELKKLGMKDVSVFGRIVSGKFPVESLDKLNNVNSLKFARPSYKPIRNVGSVSSQGDTAQRSHIARKNYKVNGKGVTIGVISDSYNALDGASEGVKSGDLPGPGNPNGKLNPVNVLMDAPGSDEGRAMLEIVHDVAPGSKLSFHTAIGGQAVFANGILDLAKAGAKVIVDDISYLAEPYFQDGIITQAVDEVAKKGVAYFSSAGNQSRESFESAFKDSGIEPLGPDFGPAHDFGGGDIFQEITIPTGGTILLILQWDDPFYSVSGNGAKSDIDFFLLNSTKDSVLTASVDFNIGDDPIEGIFFENLGEDTKFNLMFTKASGPSPRLMKYIDYEGYFTINEYATNSSTITGHSNAQGAISVGAARYDRTPEYGVNPPRIEAFSSAGGTKILFDKHGNRTHPINRFKPEITGPNGANTTFFIPGLDYEGDGWPNFFGTSASAPHAAAVGALILDANEKCNKADILWALEQSAIDMDDPQTPHFDVGFDYISGYGFIQADLAIAAALRGKKHLQYLTLQPVCSENPLIERKWKIRNPNKFSVNVTATVLNSEEAVYVLAKPGETYFSTKAVDGLNIAFLTWKDDRNYTKFIANISFGETCRNFANARVENSSDVNSDNEAISVVRAFPNPVEDKLKLQLLNVELTNVNVTMHNPQGQKIYERVFDSSRGEDEINMADLPKGLYLLKVNHSLYGKTIKILKQ